GHADQGGGHPKPTRPLYPDGAFNSCQKRPWSAPISRATKRSSSRMPRGKVPRHQNESRCPSLRLALGTLRKGSAGHSSHDVSWETLRPAAGESGNPGPSEDLCLTCPGRRRGSDFLPKVTTIGARIYMPKPALKIVSPDTNTESRNPAPPQIAAGVPGAQEHPAHSPLHRAGPDTVQGMVEGLTPQ